MSTPPISSRWVEAQRSTPSFATAADNTLAGAAALERPMPAALAPYGAATTAEALHGQTPPGKARRTAAGSPVASPSTALGRARTPTATASSARKPIHEDLLERGRLYEQRREALQERSIRQEMRRCRSVPKVSAPARSLERGGKIIDRLYKMDAEKKKMAEFKAMEVDRREAKVFDELFKPKLSRRGQRTQGRTMKSQHDLWEYKREAKIHDQRLEAIAREMSAVQDGPDINPRSEALAAKRREKEGMAGYTHIEAMIERDRLSKLAQWEREQLRENVENPHTPRITEMAARMRSEMGVVDRLMARGAEREAKLRAMAREREEEAEREHRAAQQAQFQQQFYAPSTMSTPPPPRQQQQQQYHQHESPSAGPASRPGTPTSAARRRAHEASPAVDGRPDEFGDVYSRNAEFARRRERKLEEIRREERRRHNPDIDPMSAAMARDNPESTVDRLLRPRTPTRAAATTDGAGTRSGNSTPPPGPRVGSQSPSVASARRPATPVGGRAKSPAKQDTAAYDRLMQAERQRQRRLEAARAAQREEDSRQAPFTPSLARGTIDRLNNNHQSQHGGGDDSPVPSYDFHGAAASPPPPGAAEANAGGMPSRSPTVQRIYDRTMQWARKRDERIDNAKSQREAAALQECTFEPDVSAADERRPLDAGIYGGDGKAWGYEDYVARVQSARNNTPQSSAAAAASVSNHTGSGHHHTTTVPQTFELGPDHRDVRVPSLQPPVRAPVAEREAASSPEATEAARQLAESLMHSRPQGAAGGGGSHASIGGGTSGGFGGTGSARSSTVALGNATASERPTAIQDDDDDDHDDDFDEEARPY